MNLSKTDFISPHRVRKFGELLLQWHFESNQRKMPWKLEVDPYKIWLSEIILQQTRVEQGTPYYEKFIDHYPTVVALAAASREDVYKLWEGLGYYTRCRNLHETAKWVAALPDAKFPRTYEELLQLKGVGAYTAAAIASFAYGAPHAVVDGNVIRVLSRYFLLAADAGSTLGKQQFQKLASQVLVKNNSGAFNQAIMDFGATICKPQNPLCESCVFKKNCAAFIHNQVSQLPIKLKRPAKKHRDIIWVMLKCGNQTLVRQRTEMDVWRLLFEFIAIEAPACTTWSASKIEEYVHLHYGLSIKISDKLCIQKQQLTHQSITAGLAVASGHASKIPPKFAWKTDKQLKMLPFPKVLRDLMIKKIG